MSLRPSASLARHDHDVAPPSESHVGLRRAVSEEFESPRPGAVAFLARHARGAERLRLAADGSWFEAGGVRSDISRRPVLRRVLAALVAHHHSGRVAPLTMQEVLSAGWPNERCVGDSGAARVYQTVKRLRQLGLGAFLDHDGRGYWLKGDLSVSGAAATAA